MCSRRCWWLGGIAGPTSARSPASPRPFPGSCREESPEQGSPWCWPSSRFGHPPTPAMHGLRAGWCLVTRTSCAPPRFAAGFDYNIQMTWQVFFSSFSVSQQHVGLALAALQAHVCLQYLSLGLHGRHHVNKELSEMFLQPLFAPRIPRESPSAASSQGLIIPVVPGQGRHQLHPSCFSASTFARFHLLLPPAHCSTEGFSSGQSNSAPPRAFGTFGRIEVKQQGKAQAGESRSAPRPDTCKSQPAHLKSPSHRNPRWRVEGLKV